MGGDVTEAVLSILNFGHILNKINFTHILLIPKIKDPQHMVDYRPISLSNVVSRIVSKNLANAASIEKKKTRQNRSHGCEA